MCVCACEIFSVLPHNTLYIPLLDIYTVHNCVPMVRLSIYHTVVFLLLHCDCLGKNSLQFVWLFSNPNILPDNGRYFKNIEKWISVQMTLNHNLKSLSSVSSCFVKSMFFVSCNLFESTLREQEFFKSKLASYIRWLF